MTRNQKLVIVISAIALILLTCVGAFALFTFFSRSSSTEVAVGSKPIVSIKSPPPGTAVPINEDVLVQIAATDVVGVIRVELWVNGVLVAAETSPLAQGLSNFSPILKWKPTAAGTYNLEARAINRNNQTSDPTSVVVSAQAGATPLPTPTPGATNTPIIIVATNPPIPTATNTNVPPAATNTNVPLTATNTSVPPTATNTSAPPTATNTGVPPTATNTNVPPSATPTNTAIPFLVTGVTASVSPATNGLCPTAFTFSAVISTNGPGTVTYVWERSDGASAPNQTIAFSGAGSQTVMTTWTLSASYVGWQRVRILTPNARVSNQANFTLACTYRTGSLDIPQTFSADLDEGMVTSGSTSDIWFEAVTATQRYITPRNGAKISNVGTSSVGYAGCVSASLSTSRININDLPVGSYVCVRTSAGRYSQFRVNAPAVGPSPGTLHIGFTTWK